MEIISDKQWFYENVLCLLSNAAKYCDGGTVTVTVEHSSVIPPESQSQSQRTVTESSDVTLVDRACTSTSTSPVPPQPGIIISVEDTGIGISEERRKDLFKPLKQTDRQSGGTGLGLYCLSNRVAALDGTRGVSSRTNGLQGSLFWFAIPYHPPPHFLTTHSMEDLKISPFSPLEPELSSQENIAALMTSSIPFVPIPTPSPTPILIPYPLSISIPSIHRNQLGNLRFLVVDDSPSIVKVLNRVLTNQKYAVDTAENGKFALDRMKEAFVSRSLDIVLMDLQMPIMDGIEAVTLYRQYEDSQRPQSSSIYPSPFCSLSTSGATSTLSASSAASSPAHASPKESSPSPGERSPSYPSLREIDQYHDHDTDTDTLKVNNNNNNKSLFIIGMSASSDEKYEVAALTAGMNYFLPKPFTMNELQPLIERFRTIQEA